MHSWRLRTGEIVVNRMNPRARSNLPSDAKGKTDGLPRSPTCHAMWLVGELGAKVVRAVHEAEQHNTDGAPHAGEADDLSWYDFALEYLAMRWPTVAPKARDEINEGLTAVTKSLLLDVPDRPEDATLHRALRNWAFVVPGPVEQDLPDETRAALAWVAAASRPLADLDDPAVTRSVLDVLRFRLDGSTAAVETLRRKRKVLVNAVQYGIERGLFTENPVTRSRWCPPKVALRVDPRVVVNPGQARELLDAVSYVGGYRRARGRRLVGFFAGIYYAGLRPAEAVAVCEADCGLPARGWGEAVLHRTRPPVGKKWTGTGQAHDDRGLKGRAQGDTRVVPLPPQLVAIWRQSLDAFGTADDGRLFFNERGDIVGATTYDRVWREARRLALPPHLVATPLAARPYDLRHSALST